jgi:hypothetical protein
MYAGAFSGSVASFSASADFVGEAGGKPRRTPHAVLRRHLSGGSVSVHRFELPRHEHPFIGTWHIYSMELWDESYFNMEVQAFIDIRPDNLGSFQFGLVSGGLHGHLERVGEKQRFVFTWEGSDEMDAVSGSGWLQLKGENELLGSIKLHLGDCSKFKARRAVVGFTAGQG